MDLLKMIVGGHDMVGLFVNLVILCLFVVALRDILASWNRLGFDRSLIKAAGAGLPKLIAEESELLTAPDAGEYVLRTLRVPPSTLLGQRIQRVMQLRDAGLGHRDVLQQLTGERVSGYGALARQIGSSLTLLGLLGTVFGLSVALLKIGGASTQVKGIKDLEMLSQALAGTMGGMQTAFGCTLAGLLTALILSFLNHALRRKQSAVLNDLEEFLVCRFLPTIERVDPDADSVTKAFVSVLQGVTAQLESLSKNMLDSAEAYRLGSADVRETLATLNTTVSGFGSTLAGVASGQSEFIRAMDANREALSGLREVVDRSSGVISEDARLMREAAAACASAQTSLVNHHNSFKDFVAQREATFTEALGVTIQKQSADSRKALESLLDSHVKRHEGVMQSVSDLVLDLNQLNGRGRGNDAAGGHA